MSSFVIVGIILLSLGLMAYPLIQLVPTEHQKNQQIFRQAAIKLGIHIQIRSPELPPELTATYPEVKQSVAYFLMSEDSVLNTTFCAIRSKHHTGRWFWLNNKQPNGYILSELQPLLNDLPNFISAIEIGAAGSALFWRETGDVRRVEIIHSQLKKLRTTTAT